MKKNAQLILDIVSRSAEHLTAEQIHMALRESGNRMALATVYNNLAQLHAEGRIRKVCVEGYPDRYDNMTRHDHLVCRVCGKLSDIHFRDLTELLQSQTDEELLSYDLQVSYLCPACRKAARGAGTTDR
ncbi:MAG: transcriptional repressor [Clostridia bacterium]|nr:transcriptional repressor [Clostridia bacterium]